MKGYKIVLSDSNDVIYIPFFHSVSPVGVIFRIGMVVRRHLILGFSRVRVN